MCSHSKKQSILRRLLFAVFTAIAALSNLNAQNYQIKQTVQVLPPYTDKLSDYFASPGKIVSIITTTGISMTDDYLYYLHGYIENTDNAGIWIGTDPGITPHPVYMQKTPGVGFAPYTLTYSELQQIFSEQTLKYQGITREQVQQNGLPAGSYRICFRLFIKTGWMNQFEEASRSCSAPFRIEKKAAIVDQTVQVLPPYTNKLSDYFESPGKIQSVIFVTQYPDNQALFNVRGMLEQVDGNVRIGSGQFKTSVRIDGTPSGNNVSFPPYTLTHTNYREMFREPMVYQGITRDQVQRDGLPEGNYRICFVLSNARTDEEIGLFCSASFRIQKKEAIVNQTVQVLPPYTNKLSDYLESPGKIQSVITVTQYPDNQADLDMTGTLEQVDGNIRIGSGQNMASVRITGTPSGNNVIFPPYTVTHNDYRNVFREPMVYQGITREQVQRNGLPEGTYRLCFQLRKSHSAVVIGSYCSAPFQIRKKNAVVNQAVMVMPPYTNKLSDYFESPGKIRNVITIAQYPDNDASLRVQGTLESTDGKIAIGSAQHAASVQIKGTPSGNQTIFTPYTLTYNELRDIFKEPMNYQGITREQVLRDGLPDGSYRLCFKLYNAQRNQLLSQACSPPFMVTPPMQSALEPPQLIQPYDGSELPPEQKQTVQFTWTMPPGAPATTQYMIKIIEVNDRYANYRDMLRNSSYPAFFETTVRGVPTYLYTPANPAFKEDKMYAWVVRAIGNNINTPAAIVPSVTFKNDGYSEPAVFTFKKSKEVKVEPPKKEKKPKETPPIVSEEGLKIFVPECRNCNENFEGLTNNIPEGGSTYYLQGHTLNPNLLSGPNAGADPKGRKPANSDVKTDLGGTSLASGSGTKIEIPADAIAVNNARNFYLRWEDKSSLLAKRQPKPGEGIIYRLQIREAASEHLVWEKDVWERNSYEQTKKGLPFVDGQKYMLHVTAMRGVVTPNGFAAVIDAKGKPDVLASSCQCEFTYMELDDVSDLVEYTVKGKLLYKFEHHPEKYPLTTTTATLTRYTRLIDAKTGKPSPICPKMPTPNDDRHSVPVKINDDGTFEATIYARPDGGLIEKDQEIAGIAGPGARGDLYEFFNLELNSPYYTLGKKEERLSKTEVNLSDKTVDLGEITYNVWSYTLEVEVSKGYKGSDNKVKGTYRELNPPNVNGQVKRVMFGLEGYEDMPYYEGDILPSQPKGPYGKSLITKGKVEIREGSDGKEHTYVTFDRLICNFQYNDHYHVLIEQELEENGKKKTYYTNEFSRTEKYLDFKYVPTGTEQMQAEKDEHSNFLVKRKAVLLDNRPPRSTVKGKLVFADPSMDKNKTQPLPNTDIALVVTYLMKDKDGKQVMMNIADLRERSEERKIQINRGGNAYSEKSFFDSLMKLLPEAQNTILATTRTDAEGNFEFKNFAMIDSCMTRSAEEWGLKDLMDKNAVITRTVRLVVNNSQKTRWLNPAEDIRIQPNHEMTFSLPFKALLNTYRLWIRPVGDPDNMTLGPNRDRILKGAEIQLLRLNTYSGESASVFHVDKQTVPNDKGCLFSIPKHWVRFYRFNTERSGREYGPLYGELPNDLRIIIKTRDDIGEFAFEEKSILYPLNYYKEEDGIRYDRFLTEYASAEKSGRQKPIFPEKFELCSNDFAMDADYQSTYRFADEYKPTECTINIRMRPKRPIISGRVMDAENRARSVEAGSVLLKYEYNHGRETRYWNGGGDSPRESGHGMLERKVSQADGQGFFKFEDLYPNFEIDWERWNTNPETIRTYGDSWYRAFSSSDYQLCVKAKGYTLAEFRQAGKEPVKDVGDKWFPAEPMKPKMGQQIHFPQILMGPDGWITGCVIDEEGYALEALTKTTRSVLIETKNAPPGKSCPGKQRPLGFFGGSSGSFKGYTNLNFGLGRNWFRVPAPSGYSDTLFVMPRNISKYFSDTLLIPVMPEGEYNVKPVVLKERMHRIRIVVHPQEELGSIRGGLPIGGTPIGKLPGLSGVKVKIDAQGVEPIVTNDQGVAEFKFVNNAQNFHYEIIPSDESDYIAKTGELTNVDSKEMITYRIMLKRGATVSGKVTSDGKPVPGAEVWVINGNGKRLAKSDKDGRYTLRGIKPVGESSAVSPPAPAPAKGKAKRGKSGKSSLSKAANVAGNVATSVTGKISADVALISTGKCYATIHCAPPADDPEFSNLRGMDEEVSFPAEDGSATADFELEMFYKANIRSLHGFGITVTDIQEDGGDNYRITGCIHLDKVPGSFEVQNRIDQNAQFKNLKVKASAQKDEKNRPYLEAVGGFYSIGLKQMDVTLKAGGGHDYSVELENEGDAFLKVTGDGVTGGFIHSKARIKPNSFKFTDVDITFGEDQFFLSDLADGKSGGGVTSFKRYLGKPENAEENKSFRLHDRKGEPMRFKFIAFDAISPIAQSRLGTDGVITLKPDVWFINPLLKPVRNDTIRLNLPEIKMTPEEINRGGLSLKELTIEFEKWKIVAKNCIVDATRGGIVSKDVVLRTGSLDFPAKNFLLNKDQFLLDDFEMERLPLGKDVASIDIEPDCSFQFALLDKCGMDMKTHLMLSLVKDGGTSPVGRIEGLPEFGQDLVFQSIMLTSDGGQTFGFATNSEKIRLYDVVDFLPYTINSYEDEFNLDGAINYGIPLIPSNINQKLIFKKGKRGKLELTIGGSDISFKNVGTFKSLMSRKKDQQLLSDGLAELHGTIEEPGALAPIRVVVRKRRTSPGNYRIWMDLEDRDKPSQSICMGGGQSGSGDAEFRIEKAGMVVDSKENKWDFLSLKLVPAGGYGDKSGFGTDPLYFVLSGALRTETDVDREKRHIRITTDDPDKEGDAWRTVTDIDFKKQQIKMVGTDRDPQQEGVPQDGFMDFKLVYDHPRQELTGSMSIKEKNVGGVKFSGDLHIVIGRPGFYFMGAGMFMTSPFGKIDAGILFGYYNDRIPTHIWNDILKYSARQEVPCTFTGESFKGFYALGAFSLPLATFDYSFDFGIASGGVKLDVGAEASVFGSFQSGNNELGFSAMIFADAAAYLNAVTCTSISAKARATIKGEAALKLSAPYTARLTVCGDVAFGGCLKQGLPTLAGCVPILSLGKSFAFHIGCTGEIDLKGDLKEPRITETSYGRGTCKMSKSCQIGVIKDDPCGDWEEDEERVNEIKEQQKREQEEQEKKQQNK